MNWLLISLLFGLCVAQEVEVSLEHDGPSLFQLAENATISCRFNIPDAELENVVVSWWIGSGSSTKKVGKIRVNSSSIYGAAPDNIILSSERFEDGYADLIVMDIGIIDQSTYICEVDDEHVAKRIDFLIEVYSLPTVTIEDVKIDLDIRPPLLPKPEPTKNLEMETGSLFSNDTKNGTEPNDNTTEEIDDPAGEAIPPPESMGVTAAAIEEDGNVTIVRCNVVNAYPKPNSIVFHAMLTTTDSSWNILQSQFEDTSETNPDGTFNVMAELRIVPTADLDGAVFECSAFVTSNNMEASSENESSPIQVKYLSDSIEIKISPSSAVNSGSRVVISCESNGNPPPMKYLKLPSDGIEDVTEGPYTFTAALGDEGTYECSASYSEYEEIEVMATKDLEINWMNEPEISGPSVGTQGESVTLQCSASSNVVVQYRWFKDGNRIGNKDTFEISSVEGSDSGEYTCEATGTTRRTVKHQLTVQTKCDPTINEKVEPVPGKVDVFSVVLTCTALANPECEMRMSGHGTDGFEEGKSEVVLKIPEMEKQKKAVSFTCTASNDLSSKNTTVELADVCCTEELSDGLSTGVIVLIVIIVIAVVAAIAGAAYYMKKQRTKEGSTAKKEKTIDDVEADKLNSPTEEELVSKLESHEDSRLNNANLMRTFSQKQASD